MSKSPLAIREDAKHLVNKLKNSTIQAPQAIQILCSYIEDLSVHLEELQKWSASERLKMRYEKFRAHGQFSGPKKNGIEQKELQTV